MAILTIFDLDGPLFSASKDIHYNLLNDAISEIAGEEFAISYKEHLTKYDGLPTTDKLIFLSQEKGLEEKLHSKIWEKKQELTNHYFQNIPRDPRIIEIIKQLKRRDIKVAVCSNSIKSTIKSCLTGIGVIDYIDLILSAEDVPQAKPAPFMYWKCMVELNCLPENTVIIEDSPKGLAAAYGSTAKVLRVKNNKDYTLENILEKLNMKDNKKNKWVDSKLNILILMSGNGSRFAEKGYTFPKVIIDVKGQPMIARVLESINIDAHYIFVVKKEHREQYNLDSMLNLIAPGCDIVEIDKTTEGAACSALYAEHLINNENPLIICNADQMFSYNSDQWMYSNQEKNIDGSILTFNSIHPKWSFVKKDEEGFIIEVAEKNPISDIATVGCYYYRMGGFFVEGAKQMIRKNIRVNQEFYVCPVFNELVEMGLKINDFPVQEMIALGTPEDLENYLRF